MALRAWLEDFTTRNPLRRFTSPLQPSSTAQPSPPPLQPSSTAHTSPPPLQPPVMTEMEIAQIYVYPIKSLRGISLSSARATTLGLQHDRRFMLIRTHSDGRTENMLVSKYPQMCLFHTALSCTSSDPSNPAPATSPPSPVSTSAPRPVSSSISASTSTISAATSTTATQPSSSAAEASSIIVTHGTSSITIPLTPDPTAMERVQIDLHRSPTEALDMGSRYAAWFSAQFDFPVRLVYLGSHTREPLMTLPPAFPSSNVGALSSLLSTASSWLKSSHALPAPSEAEERRITFADCAPYLFVSSASLAHVSARLPGVEGGLDVTKFRPNIVVRVPDDGAESSCRADTRAWEEDFWGAVHVRPPASSATEGGVWFDLVHNCARCVSLNVDYSTGAFGTGEEGKLLKTLSRDRRVDSGSRWSPVFGRYAFLGASGREEQANRADGGGVIRVGDEVLVTKRNEERTTWDWPGLSTT